LLGRAGFTGMEVTTEAFRMRFADGSSFLRHTFIRVAFMPAWKQVVPADAVVRTFAALEHKLNTVAAERGELALTIPMAYVEARKP
jgi:arsenite methyltransferase